MNQTLKGALQKLVNENQEDWDQLLDNVLFAYRTSRQASTKYTPFFLMYEHEARLPIDITQPKPEEDDIPQELTLDERVKKMIAFQKEMHDKACDNVVKAQEKQNQHYDAKHNGRTELKVRSIQNSIILCYIHRLFILLQVDDKVLVQEMKNESRKGGKLDLQFRGPYTIAEDLGKGKYKWKDGNGKVLTRAYNCHRLKARLIQGWSTHTISYILAHKHASRVIFN